MSLNKLRTGTESLELSLRLKNASSGRDKVYKCRLDPGMEKFTYQGKSYVYYLDTKEVYDPECTESRTEYENVLRVYSPRRMVLSIAALALIVAVVAGSIVFGPPGMFIVFTVILMPAFAILIQEVMTRDPTSFLYATIAREHVPCCSWTQRVLCGESEFVSKLAADARAKIAAGQDLTF